MFDRSARIGSRRPKGRTDAYPLWADAYPLWIFLKIRATKCLQGELASPSSKHSKVKMP
jgi:hypothetical protein